MQGNILYLTVLLRINSLSTFLQDTSIGDDECMIVDVPKTPPQIIDVSEDEGDDDDGDGIKKFKVKFMII